jgi:hypothetical protein
VICRALRHVQLLVVSSIDEPSPWTEFVDVCGIPLLLPSI